MDSEDGGWERILPDLQLFGEKSEDATPKRRQEARQKGQVFRSTEINTVVTLLVALQTLRLAGGQMYRELLSMMRHAFAEFPRSDLTASDLGALTLATVTALLRIILPIMGLVLLAGVIANLFQVGFLLTAEPLSFKLDRLNPITGWQRLFSKRAMVELVKALFKLIIVSVTVYLGVRQDLLRYLLLPDMEISQAVGQLTGLVYGISQKIVLTLLVLAILDYLYQRWEHDQQLKMSKQEVKEEMKQSEGDPQIKARVRQIQRGLARRRMMAEVPRADVVITNPSHYAVALRYDPKTMSAPVVVAKGVDYLAVKIKQTAQEHRVVLVENRILARSLYDTVEIGGAVPETLYQAVAEVLAFVYRLKGIS